MAGIPRADNRCECSGRTRIVRPLHREDGQGRAGLYDGAGQPYSGKDTGVKGIPVFVCVELWVKRSGD